MTDGLSVCVAQLFLQIRQPPAVTQDVILDVPLEIGNLCDAALEQCVKDDFLMSSSEAIIPVTSCAAHLGCHLLGVLFAQKRDRAADVQQVVSCNTGEHVKSHLRCS